MRTRTTSGRQAGIWRPGRTDPVLAGLLGAVVVALVALIVVVLLQCRRDTRPDQSQPSAETAPVASGQTGKQEKPSSPPVSQPPPETPAVAPGQTVKREETPAPPPPPKTVGKPDRLREILQPGKTYEVVATVDLANAVREREW
jgi:type IV secretory pathway VirB10-like protein